LFRGHDVRVYEPANAWSVQNLIAEHGEQPIADFHRAYPALDTVRYEIDKLNLDDVLAEADVVLVHEWNDHALVHRIGQHSATRGSYQLLFHDTHHRAVTQPAEMSKYDLTHYDGVLTFGQMLSDLYLKRRWTKRAWTWHEAADTRLFRPITGQPCDGDLIWVGNWGDEERTAELQEFLLDPVKSLGLKARVHGVRYPDHATSSLAAAGIEYRGWLPNFAVPDAFARFKLTVHVPRRPYVEALPGIPTIRVFEALACGMPLICSPWNDAEHLFEPGEDYLIARDGREMRRHLKTLLDDPEYGRQLAAHGHRTILSRHTCAHRVDQLLNIIAELKVERPKRRRRQRGSRQVQRKEHRWVTA
ncbi:MAG TPA: glycosyltransferase, partial [Tepidisphaeraceae bacterium]|nr:glycosyltransferase [Tepidisphaeraceae bacterium]